MNICFATSECVPFSKTGGLADVSGALPKALAPLGCNVKVFTPLYGSISTVDYDLVFAKELEGMAVGIGDRLVYFNTWYGKLPDSDVEVYFIDCPEFYHRGTIYTDDADEAQRYILLQHAAFNIMQRYGWSPDIIHCHDWQTALMPVMLRESYAWDGLFEDTASLITIHNIGYQGLFPAGTIKQAGLPQHPYYFGGPFELHGAFSFLKAGLVYADGISTVSRTYAQEIQTPAFGANLDGVLRSRKGAVFGIVNGVDIDEWNPATDPHITKHYDVDTLEDKEVNKQALLERFDLPYDPDVPVFGIVSRLVGQKGFELLHPILEDLLQHFSFQLIMLGSGEARHENFFNWAQSAYPTRVGVYIGYNNALAHQIEAGVDAFLMPSSYEPCGLNQLYSLRYGTIPVVHKTGGLADTVFDFDEHHGHGNGYSFNDHTPYALYTTIARAIERYHDRPAWETMQRRGMTTDFSWTHAAQQYADLYQRLL